MRNTNELIVFSAIASIAANSGLTSGHIFGVVGNF